MTELTVKTKSALPVKKMDEFMNDGVFGRYAVLNEKTRTIHKASLSGKIGEMSDMLRIDDSDVNSDHLEVLEVAVVDGRADYTNFIAKIEGNFGITYS